MPSSGGQRSRELFSPAANRAEQAQTLATQETKWKESQRRHSTQAANVRMEPGKPDSGPIGLNAIALWAGDGDYRAISTGETPVIRWRAFSHQMHGSTIG